LGDGLLWAVFFLIFGPLFTMGKIVL
jgi:hypothetical protein